MSRRCCVLADHRVLERLQGLDLPVARSRRWTAAKPLFCDQTLPSTCADSGRTMLTWVMSLFMSGGRLPHLEFLGLRVELRDGGLVHHAEPHVAVAVGTEPKHAGRPALLELGHRIFRVLAGLRIELAESLLAEIRVPGDAVRIDHHVVRLDGRARQVPLGDDDAGRAPGRARQGLERELPGVALVQIDGGEVFGALAESALARIAALFEQALGQSPLRVQWRRLVGVAGHALEDIDEASASCWDLKTRSSVWQPRSCSRRASAAACRAR